MNEVIVLLKKCGIPQLFNKVKIVDYVWDGKITLTDYVLMGLFVVILFYIYTKWEANYFKRRGVKNIPFDFPFIGNMYKVVTQKEHFIDLVSRTYKAFPDQRYVGHMQINKPIIMIRDLDIVKQIGIKAFDHFPNHQMTVNPESDSLFGNHLFSLKGEKWHDMRVTLSPAFTSSKIKNMFGFVTEIAHQMTKYYLEMKNDDRNQGVIEVELKDAFSRCTNDVIATSAFGIKINSLTERNNEFYAMANIATDFSGLQQLKFLLFSIFPKLSKFLNIPLFSDKIKNFYREMVLNTMATREEQGIVRQDMIHLLMEARKGQLKHEDDVFDYEDGFATVEESQIGKLQQKRKWTDDDIVAQALLFLFAGFESGSTVLCFLAHEITINVDIQRKLQKEIDEFFVKKSDRLEYSDLSQLKYLDMVVSETLRMWPPAMFTDRECVKPYELPPVDDTKVRGHTVMPGEGIWIPIYGFHHDPKYFPEPEKFDPERFSNANKGNIQPFSYLPFGIGPRNCIGSRFALMEVKAVLIHMLARFDFVRVGKTQHPIKISKNTVHIRAENGFWIGLKPRRQE